MNTETKRKVREATREFERGYREDEGDPRLMAPPRKAEAFGRRCERLSRELEASEGGEARREVLRKFEARMRREGYDEDEVASAVRRANEKIKGRKEAEDEARRGREKFQPLDKNNPDDLVGDDEDDADEDEEDD